MHAALAVTEAPWAPSPHPLVKALNSKHSCTPYTHGALLVLVEHEIQALQLGISQGTATGGRSRLREMGRMESCLV